MAWTYSLVLFRSVSMPGEPLRSGNSARFRISSRCPAPIRPAFLAKSPIGPGSIIRSPGATTVARTAGRDLVGLYLRTRLEPVLPIDHNLIPFSDAAGDQRDVALRHVHLHWLQVRRAILDGVHIGALRASLDGCQGNHDCILANRYHQADVDKLVRP